MLSRAQVDAWRESMALIRKGMIAIECGDWERARREAAELREAAKKLGGEGSEGVTADGLEALALSGLGDDTGPQRLQRAIDALAVADAKAMFAYVLTSRPR